MPFNYREHRSLVCEKCGRSYGNHYGKDPEAACYIDDNGDLSSQQFTYKGKSNTLPGRLPKRKQRRAKVLGLIKTDQ